MPNPKLVFTAPKITHGFMVHDIELLKPFVDVIPLDLSECRGWQRYTYFTRLLVALIRDRAQVVFCYFVLAKYTPLLATLTRLLRRKLIIVTGGIDATYVPDIRWGDMGKPLRRALFAYVMRLADSVLPFSDSARDDLLQYGKPKRIRTAYPAVDTEVFKPAPRPRACRAVTALYEISHDALLQKGVEAFVRAAALAPEIEFLVIGEFIDDTLDYLRTFAPPNAHFTLRRYDKYECAEAFQSAQVYVQASAHEGFGVSLAEAMACACVPVVANRYAMPETVGGTGYVVPFNDPAALAKAVRQAIVHPEKGDAARRRVVENFSAAHRQRVLRAELEFVLGKSLSPETEN